MEPTQSTDPTIASGYEQATGSTSNQTTAGIADKASAAGHAITDTWQNAVSSGKQWLQDSGLLDQAQQLPQAAKDTYEKVRTRVSGLSTTEKAVGVGLLAAGLAFLATRARHRSNDDDSSYRKRPARSPFDKHNEDRGSQRSWGNGRRFGERATSGSGHNSPENWRTERQERPWGSRGGQRRDQGPGRYDSRTSGRQNPNNSDDLNSAF